MRERLKQGAFSSASSLTGDTNGDNTVDFDDFLALSAEFGVANDSVFSDSDFDHDGDVDFNDFLALSGNYGAIRS